MPKIKNYSRSDFKGQASRIERWGHDETNVRVKVDKVVAASAWKVEAKKGNKYLLRKRYGTKKEAVDKAKEWMRNNPNP